MKALFHNVEVDGIAFPVSFRGFDGTMEVRASYGRVVEFRPWTCEKHLSALKRHLKPSAAGVEMDARAFSRDVLDSSGIPADLADELIPLALWWAAGGEELPAGEIASDGWFHAGKVAARLQPWSNGKRLQALADNGITAEDGAPSFNVAGYLEAMLADTIVETDPSGQKFHDFDSQSTMAVVQAVIQLNVPRGWEDELTARLREGSQQMAVNTLRLCRALGWTPSQVWATPAPEIDHLLALLDRVEGTPSATSRPQGFADHPDAVVIEIEDDEP